MGQKFALDVWYVDHRSTRLDLEILGRTVSQVFSGQGVGAPVTRPWSRSGERRPAAGGRADGVDDA